MTVYNSWEEREKAESIMILKQKLSENELTYEELTKVSDELQKKYEKLRREVDELEAEIFITEHIRWLMLLLEVTGHDKKELEL